MLNELVRNLLHNAITITLENRENHGRIAGLDATVRLPLAHNGS